MGVFSRSWQVSASGKEILDQLVWNGRPLGDYLRLHALSTDQVSAQVFRSFEGWGDIRAGTQPITILKGRGFEDEKRSVGKIFSRAQELELVSPPPQAALLAWDKYPRDALSKMGLEGLVVMHEPLEWRGEDGKADKILLVVSKGGISYFSGRPEQRFAGCYGFLFFSKPLSLKG